MRKGFGFVHNKILFGNGYVPMPDDQNDWMKFRNLSTGNPTLPQEQEYPVQYLRNILAGLTGELQNTFYAHPVVCMRLQKVKKKISSC